MIWYYNIYIYLFVLLLFSISQYTTCFTILYNLSRFISHHNTVHYLYPIVYITFFLILCFVLCYVTICVYMYSYICIYSIHICIYWGFQNPEISEMRAFFGRHDAVTLSCVVYIRSFDAGQPQHEQIQCSIKLFAWGKSKAQTELQSFLWA